MAKRFKQFLLENEIRKDDIADDSTIRTIVESLPHNDSTKMIIAKFVLYCAEDVFEFINNDATRNASRNCIDLIKQYINDPQSITTQELRNAATAAYTASINASNATSAAHSASSAAYSAATAIAGYATYAYSTNITYNAAYYAANATAHAAYYAAAIDDDDNIERIRKEKLNEYKQYLNMLTARYHHSDENTFNKINQLTQNKPQTEQQWFSFLTQIIDELEVKNIIRELPDGRFVLDGAATNSQNYFPDISANSQLELIDIISRNERMRDLIYSWFV